MLEPEQTLSDRIAADLEGVELKDEALARELMAGVDDGGVVDDRSAPAAAEAAMSVLRNVRDLPQPSAEEVEALPGAGQISELRTQLEQARQDPRNVDNLSGRDILRELLRRGRERG